MADDQSILTNPPSEDVAVHVRDFQATILSLFGINHEKFTYKYQGLDQRLTGVEPASPVKALVT